MEVTSENLNSAKLESLCSTARTEGRFGKNLAGLSGDKIRELKTIVREALQTEIDLFAPSPLGKLALSTRSLLNRFTGGVSPFPKNVIVLQKLQKELEEYGLEESGLVSWREFHEII
jgi:hypothetical protein